jgi:hypothetical protein
MATKKSSKKKGLGGGGPKSGIGGKRGKAKEYNDGMGGGGPKSGMGGTGKGSIGGRPSKKRAAKKR